MAKFSSPTKLQHTLDYLRYNIQVLPKISSDKACYISMLAFDSSNVLYNQKPALQLTDDSKKVDIQLNSSPILSDFSFNWDEISDNKFCATTYSNIQQERYKQAHHFTLSSNAYVLKDAELPKKLFQKPAIEDI